MMSTFFSINHACVNSTLCLASAELGLALGGQSAAVMYVTYSLAALLFATSVVTMLGTKRSLVASFAMYCVYIVCFLSGYIIRRQGFETAGTLVIFAGSLVGGVGAGWLWTAQGVYFTASSQAYAAAALVAATPPGLTKKQLAPTTAEHRATASARLSAVFAGIFLGGEVVLGLIVTMVMRTYVDGEKPRGVQVCLGVLATLALLSTIGLAGCVDDVTSIAAPEAGRRSRNGAAIFSLAKMGDAARLFWFEPRMMLLAPYQISFGLMSSLNNLYINGVIVASTVGDNEIGMLSAVLAGVAALVALPLGYLAVKCGKPIVLLLGTGLFLTECTLMLLLPEAAFRQWGMLAVLYGLQGGGRAVWESTNKGIIADYFGQRGGENEAAFANVVLWSGGSAALGFLLFPHLTGDGILWVCLASLVFSAMCFGAAHMLHLRRPSCPDEHTPLL